jgi:hypothetical protein
VLQFGITEKVLMLLLLWNRNQSGSLEGYTYVSNIQPFDKVKKRTKLIGKIEENA